MKEKVFYTEDEDVLNQDILKRKGFRSKSASELDFEEDGTYFIIKADEDWFEKEEVKEVLEKVDEIEEDEKEEVLDKFEEVEGKIEGGLSLF